MEKKQNAPDMLPADAEYQKGNGTLIPAQTITRVQDYLDKALKELAPYGVSFTPQERMRKLKMGFRSLLFVGTAHEDALANPELVAPDLQMAATLADFQNATTLLSVAAKAKQVEQLISDTQLAYGNRSYRAALNFYAMVANAAKRGVIGAKTIHARLKALMPQGRGARVRVQAAPALSV